MLLPIFLRMEGVLLIEKKKFDREYSTQWAEEQKYLLDNGIRYTFVKEIDGVVTWKYTKTLKLFEALVQFYSQVYTGDKCKLI